jgi:hypothetical protein
MSTDFAARLSRPCVGDVVSKWYRVLDPLKNTTPWTQGDDTVGHELQRLVGRRVPLTVSTFRLITLALSCHQLVYTTEDLLHYSILANIIFSFHELLESTSLRSQAYYYFWPMDPPISHRKMVIETNDPFRPRRVFPAIAVVTSWAKGRQFC